MVPRQMVVEPISVYMHLTSVTSDDQMRTLSRHEVVPDEKVHEHHIRLIGKPMTLQQREVLFRLIPHLPKIDDLCPGNAVLETAFNQGQEQLVVIHPCSPRE